MKLVQLFEQSLQEVNMSPSALNAFARSPQAQGVLVGFETELAVPVSEDIDDEELEYDYSLDQPAHFIDQVVDFFQDGDFGLTAREADRLRDRMQAGFADWLAEQANQQFQKVQDRRIRKLAAQDGMSEDDIDEMMSQESGSRYSMLSDQVYQEVLQDIESTVGEEDWLRDLGLRRMSDIESEYALAWPHMISTDRSNTVLQQVAQDIQQALNIRVSTGMMYHAAPREAGKWVLEPDSSISSESGYAGLELITPTPPFELAEALEWIDRVFAWARDYGCYTNSSTGFHINVSLPSQTTSDIDWLKLVLLLGDQYVLSLFERKANIYAKSAMEEFTKHMALATNFPVVPALEAMRKGLMTLASQQLTPPYPGKHVSVNIKTKYVEFRSAGGDYLENQEQIKLAMLRYVRAITLAADPEALKQEYATKLYKLLTRNSQGTPTDHILYLFTMYNAGSISKNVLINSLKSHQQELKKQKGL